LIQQGFEGLLVAYKKFDLKHNVKFWTYANYFVEGYMKKFIKQYTNIIRPSEKINDIALKIRKLDLMENNVEEIAVVIGCSKEMAITALNFLRERNTVSIYQKVRHSNNEEGNTELGDKLSSTLNTFEGIVISDFLAKLDKNEQQYLILKMRGYEPDEVRNLTGVSADEMLSIEESLKQKYNSYFEPDQKREGSQLAQTTSQRTPLLTKAEYFKMRDSGLTNEAIAKKKKISKSTVNRYAQDWRNENVTKKNDIVRDEMLAVSTIKESNEAQYTAQEVEQLKQENLFLKERISKLQEEINLLWKMQDILRSNY